MNNISVDMMHENFNKSEENLKIPNLMTRTDEIVTFHFFARPVILNLFNFYPFPSYNNISMIYSFSTKILNIFWF